MDNSKDKILCYMRLIHPRSAPPKPIAINKDNIVFLLSNFYNGCCTCSDTNIRECKVTLDILVVIKRINTMIAENKFSEEKTKRIQDLIIKIVG